VSRSPRSLRLAAPLLLVALVRLLAGPALAQELQPIPPLQARVTDLTGTLSAGQRQQLEAQLAQLEQAKGSQVAILLVPSTLPEPIEDYSLRVAEAWKLGRGQAVAQRDTGDRGAAAIDDGLLIVVAKNDRKVRIEVGYGLEGAIPDITAKRIISNAIAPSFKQGDFYGGLQAGVSEVTRRIQGEELPAPGQSGDRGAGPQGGAFDPGALLPILLVSVMVGLVLSRIFGRFIGAGMGGAGAGIMTTSLLSVAGAGLIAGFIAFLLILLLGGRGGMHRVGPHTIGRGPVIFPGGFGGGGGGFGGGGGGFGGGGASGDW